MELLQTSNTCTTRLRTWKALCQEATRAQLTSELGKLHSKKQHVHNSPQNLESFIPRSNTCTTRLRTWKALCQEATRAQLASELGKLCVKKQHVHNSPQNLESFVSRSNTSTRSHHHFSYKRGTDDSSQP
jgi:hypothetical protein